MAQPFPSFRELREFITNNEGATICEIRNHFNQRGNVVVTRPKPKCKNKQLVLAYGINGDFYTHLTNFMKEDDVIVDQNLLACRISDSTMYIGPGEFLPIFLFIKPN